MIHFRGVRLGVLHLLHALPLLSTPHAPPIRRQGIAAATSPLHRRDLDPFVAHCLPYQSTGPRPLPRPLGLGIGIDLFTASNAAPTVLFHTSCLSSTLAPCLLLLLVVHPSLLRKMAVEWDDIKTTIICELFAEQVLIGNRPNTHLNAAGYMEVQKRFKERCNIDLKKTQIKNKWDKLKIDYNAWTKLLLRQTGAGWDSEKGTIRQDDEWWEKAKKDIPGCGKFKKKGIQNEDLLRTIFSDISSTGADHWNHMSNTSNPPSSSNYDADTQTVDEDSRCDEEVQEVSSMSAGRKRFAHGVNEKSSNDKGKKHKTSTAVIIQDAITRIADSASSVAAKCEEKTSIKEVMDLVLACGATSGSNEHYIATDLFVKKEQREMFMTLAPDIRFGWLRRKYIDKYGQ